MFKVTWIKLGPVIQQTMAEYPEGTKTSWGGRVGVEGGISAL